MASGLNDVTYRSHGHVPDDGEIAALGYRAFSPLRQPFVPTADDFRAAARDVAVGDPDEQAVAVEVAAYWPHDDDDETTWWFWA